MKLEADAHIPFPRETVFTTYRDRLPELVPYLPNVRSVEVTSKETDVGGNSARVDLVNLWRANADVPKVLQAFVSPEALAWIDRAEWDAEGFRCHYRIEPKVFTDNVRCEGTNTYREDGAGTVLEMRGELTVDARGIPGVPRLLAGTISPAVEKFVVSLIRPNLLSVAEGLERFLQDEAR
ncbi:MAG: DUF2505 family protein [Myxococcota bacterium]